jgi:hypothetical protein
MHQTRCDPQGGDPISPCRAQRRDLAPRGGIHDNGDKAFLQKNVKSLE